MSTMHTCIQFQVCSCAHGTRIIPEKRINTAAKVQIRESNKDDGSKSIRRGGGSESTNDSKSVWKLSYVVVDGTCLLWY